METLEKRTWAEINLDHISHNYTEIQKRLPAGCRFLGVVKANAYGHGAPKVSALLERLGCPYLAVSCLDEAVELRKNGIFAPILILGATPFAYIHELLQYDLTQTVCSPQEGYGFAKRARELGKNLKVHLKLDTGMGRLGYPVKNLLVKTDEIEGLLTEAGLYIEGIFTHFAAAEDAQFTRLQFDRFMTFVQKLEKKAGRRFKIKHCANSTAVIHYAWSDLDMVRSGLLLFGLYPGKETGGLSLRPAMSLKTRISQIAEIEAGDTVSYGQTYTASRRLKIAVLPIGYADGLFRGLSGRMDVLIHGKRARQIGRICMDMCMVDVTDFSNISIGDVVTVFGRDGDETIPVEELAETLDTISYELICSVSKRVPRIYTGEDVTLSPFSNILIGEGIPAEK